MVDWQKEKHKSEIKLNTHIDTVHITHTIIYLYIYICGYIYRGSFILPYKVCQRKTMKINMEINMENILMICMCLYFSHFFFLVFCECACWCVGEIKNYECIFSVVNFLFIFFLLSSLLLLSCFIYMNDLLTFRSLCFCGSQFFVCVEM